MDPIADMFSQIRNAQTARKDSLAVNYSKIKLAILEILKARHQIADYRLIQKKTTSRGESRAKEISVIQINLIDQVSLEINRVSRPGRRVYTSRLDIPRPKKPRSFIILSTSRGLLDGEEARKKGLGGEIICEIR